MSLSPEELKKLKSLPIMKELKKVYDKNPTVQGSGRRMKGKGFWDDVGNWFKQAAIDVDAWAKKVKPLTALSKAAGLIGLVPGLNEVALLAPGIKGVAEFTGYGRKRGGRKAVLTANSLGQHMNPVAGLRGAVQGMGTMAQNYQSQSMRKIGTGFLGDASKAFLGFNAKDIENMDTKAVANLATAYKKLQPKMKGGSFPSHLQPFLTSKRIRGNGVSQAIGSIGNAGRIKI